jgi:hypothetical protein
MTDDADDFTLVHRRPDPFDHDASCPDGRPESGIAMDRRQRLAAAILLSAVDLPQPADKVARLWLDAARVCPGITTGEVELGAGRLAQLQQVRRLVEAMISDCPNPRSGSVT